MSSVEFALRDWLRSRTALMTALDGDTKRVDLEFKGPLTAKHVTLYRAGGAQHPYVPTETAFISVHCYGQSRAQAWSLTDLVAAALRAMIDEPLNPDVRGHGATVESIAWLPASEDTPRYVVTTNVTTSTAAPAA